MPQNPIQIAGLKCGENNPLLVIAGPCVIEDQDLTLEIAKRLKGTCEALNLGLIFKASFDKANRTSLNSYRGVGLESGLEILGRVKADLELPVTTDIHLPEQAEPVGKVCDLLQIPAFLARQTDLLQAAAATGKPVNVKKGQFMAPSDMQHVVGKIEGSGCEQITVSYTHLTLPTKRIV